MRVLFCLSVLILATPLLACLSGGEDAAEGENMGSYLFTGVLEANECGAAAPVLDTVEFRVQLRNDRGQAIWRRPDAPVTYGTVLGDTWTIQTSTSTPLYETCSMTQTETIIVTADTIAADAGPADAGPDDAGASDPGEGDAGEGDAHVDLDGGASDAAPPPPQYDFAGTHVIRVTPDAGSDCSPSLATYGGPFPALPCEVRYRLSGVPTDPLFE